jgi:hypothetical protein
MLEEKPNRKKRSLQLNEKRRKLLEGISEGMNVSEAGRVAGYGTPQSSHRAMSLIRANTPELLAKIGLPAEKLLRDTFLKELEATETVFFSFQGVVIESREVIAHDIRLRAGIELAKMHGLYPKANGHNGEDADSGQGTTININLGFLNPERAEAVLAAARERVRGGNRGQPVLDAMRDQNQGRTGPDKPV